MADNTKVETGKQLKDKQVVIPAWMRKLDDNKKYIVHRKVIPGVGSYVINVEEAKETTDGR